MSGERWLGTGLVVLAIGLAANALVGPLAFDLVDYPFSETVRNQGIGLEAVSVALVAPWSIVAGAMTWRGVAWAPILAVAPGGYTTYVMVQYVVGPNYVVNAHPVPMHLALFVLGWLVWWHWLAGWQPTTSVCKCFRGRVYWAGSQSAWHFCDSALPSGAARLDYRGAAER